jgi:putative SOS response-associated peptidase YedK
MPLAGSFQPREKAAPDVQTLQHHHRSQVILEMTRAMLNRAGWLEPGNVYPDYAAPIVWKASERTREPPRARWGMSSPRFAVAGISHDRDFTNVRNTTAPHWRPWLEPDSRCVVPATALAEPTPRRDESGRILNVWFAMTQEQPLFFFAGIWTPSKGKRAKEETADHFLYVPDDRTHCRGGAGTRS